MSKIYIVLTHTGTILSRIIKSCTKDEFSHASIALDNKLEEMYSFGRLNPYNAFLGGFVHEGIRFGTFKRFKFTETKIYSLNVDEEQYKKMKEKIKYIEINKNLYKFNTIGLFAVGLHKRIKKKNSFYCAEFVKYIIESAGIKTNLPDMIKPEDFKILENINLVYEGKLRDYNIEKNRIIEKIISVRKKEVVI